MTEIENKNPEIKEMDLDTPLVNVRTNAFYLKLGYREISRTDDTVSYRKILI